MEGEISNLINICFEIMVSLSYCYGIGKIVPKGLPTLFAILPITWLFLILPLDLHTMHLTAIISFFISWFANVKLLLFAFGKGPLSNPSLTLKQFVVVASFPINIHNQNQNQNVEKSLLTQTQKMSSKSLLINYTIKVILFIGVIGAYKYDEYIHPMGLHCLYALHIYLSLEIILAIASFLVRTLSGFELEPSFDEPYLSSSLQDFWSRRWNLAVTKIFKPMVYKPTQQLAERVIGPKRACFPAIFVTFLVSGLIHELIFYYLSRVRPSWEITQFFVVHGLSVILEVYLKKKYSAKFQIPRIVSRPLTIAFIMITAYWLFFPSLLQSNGKQKAIQEYTAMAMFLKHTFTFLINSS